MLTKDLFIGKGGHQEAYVHPDDPSKCVKIAFDPNDGDVKKELRYRRICADKLSRSKLVTKYYGEVETDKGRGLVFERVMNFDGASSLDLKDYLSAVSTAEEVDQSRALLMDFRKDFLEEGIAIVDTDITNFMVQRVSPTETQMRIVDNIGTPVLIPLVYYSDYIARRKARRVWNRIVDWLKENYPSVVDEKFYGELRA
ncbi:MAG: hypothetical protein IJ668_03975 [Selenomonadaceae bacterium]|nr:hypothetical protein [Selenomonadaceae bacterium]